MSALRLSRSGVLAGSILVAASACQDATDPASNALHLRSTGNTSWSVSLAWDAATGAASYRVRDNWAREVTVPGTQTSVTWKYPHPPLNPGATYTFSVYAVDAGGNKLASSNNVTVSLPLDKQAPTVPTFSVTSVGTRHITLNWSSTDDSPWISYIVTKDGVKVHTGWIS